jgi:hypothetical protein
MERKLPVESALERALGLQCYCSAEVFTIVEYEEYRREPTLTRRKLPVLATKLNYRCLNGNMPPDLFSPVPYTFEVDLL